MAIPGNSQGRVFRLAPAILGIASGAVFDTSSGATWSSINTGLPSTAANVRGIVIAPKTPATIYATTLAVDGFGAIFKTTDGAASWRAIGSVSRVSSVVVDACAKNTTGASIE